MAKTDTMVGMEIMKATWKRYRYKNLTYLILGLVYALVLLQSPTFHNFMLGLGNMGYIGAFIAGALFVSTFTVSVSTVLLITLAQFLHPIEIGLIAGLGAVAGDMLIFQYIKDKGVLSEIKHFFEYFGGSHISHLFHTRYFAWSVPVIGALIIASPLPDELGVSLLGISRMKTYQFLILSLILNSLGIFFIVSAAVMLGV